jgi:hypothetical protein
MKITQKDLDFIKDQEDSLDYTKSTAKKLQNFRNKFLDKKKLDHYCMCDEQERKEYKLMFYIWWSSVKEKLNTITI